MKPCEKCRGQKSLYGGADDDSETLKQDEETRLHADLIGKTKRQEGWKHFNSLLSFIDVVSHLFQSLKNNQ